jgi:hypothetical protein
MYNVSKYVDSDNPDKTAAKAPKSLVGAVVLSAGRAAAGLRQHGA